MQKDDIKADWISVWFMELKKKKEWVKSPLHPDDPDFAECAPYISLDTPGTPRSQRTGLIHIDGYIDPNALAYHLNECLREGHEEVSED